MCAFLYWVPYNLIIILHQNYPKSYNVGSELWVFLFCELAKQNTILFFLSKSQINSCLGKTRLYNILRYIFFAMSHGIHLQLRWRCRYLQKQPLFTLLNFHEIGYIHDHDFINSPINLIKNIVSRAFVAYLALKAF